MAKKTKELGAFAARMQKAMERRSMNIYELAAKVKLSYEMTRRYVAGINVPRSTERVHLIARALDVDPIWLLEGQVDQDATPRVPLVKITDPVMFTEKYAEWIVAPMGFTGIAVKMTVVLGDGFQLGDVVYVRMAEGLAPAGDRVLIEVLKAAKGGPRHLFRRVHYGQDLSVEYRAEVPGKESTFEAKDVKVLGIAEYLLTKLSKA